MMRRGCVDLPSRAFADATIELNPALRVSALPEIGYSEDEPNLLTPEQLAVLLDAVRTRTRGRWYALFAVLAFTGARVGEATALRWDDIDGDSLVIRRSHWRGRVRATTKTNRWRRVPLPKELAAILGDHCRALVAAQAPGLEEGWMFPSSRGRHRDDRGGKPTLPSVVRNALLRVLRALESDAAAKGETSPLPNFTVHGLRRTMNNLLRQTVQDKTVVRAVVGHVTEPMTEHYSHVAIDEKALAVSNVVRLVRTPSRPEVEVSVEVGGQKSESGA